MIADQLFKLTIFSVGGGQEGAWRGKEGKYEYSIRHLYGEKGARRNYRWLPPLPFI